MVWGTARVVIRTPSSSKLSPGPLSSRIRDIRTHAFAGKTHNVDAVIQILPIDIEGDLVEVLRPRGTDEVQRTPATRIAPAADGEGPVVGVVIGMMVGEEQVFDPAGVHAQLQEA